MPQKTNLQESAIRTYYEALADGVLKARKCRGCGRYTFPPTGCCEHCGSFDVEWANLSGEGTLLYATHNVTPACHPRFEPIAPYVYGHIRLKEGITVQAIVRGIKATPGALRQLYERGPVPVKAAVMKTSDLPVLTFEESA
jgi:uncharacterized OB-fold protein